MQGLPCSNAGQRRPVPSSLNFGYQYQDGKLTLYLHSSKEGRKISALSQNSSVCFEMDCSHKLVEGDVACAYSYEYQSIVGNGTAHIVDNKEEKKQALSILMRHMTEKAFEFIDSMADLVAVIKIEADSFSGKATSVTLKQRKSTLASCFLLGSTARVS